MLTIFGKKKKDDSGVQIDTWTDAGQTPAQTPSEPPDPMQTQAPLPITSQNQPATWPTQRVMGQTTPPPPPPSMRQMTPEPAQRPTPSQLPLDASFPSEETSLSRILQSLLQDVPTASQPTLSPMRKTPPDSVLPRDTPPRSPLVLSQND